MSKVLDNVTHPPAKVAKAVLLRRRRGLARGHGDDWAAALAESLRELVRDAEDRRTNLQLVVITHDEQFAHAIGTRDQADFLWRVTKDEAQHTRVEQEQIEE